MRTKIEYKRIAVTKELYDRLQTEKKEFQKIIGGGKWSISDTINELIKIANTK